MMAKEAWKVLEAAWCPGDPWRPSAAVERYYETKFRIARRLVARTVCEIGVRAGYSALMFYLAGPECMEYLGIDLGTFGGGDVNEASMLVTHAQKILCPRGAEMLWTNSRALSALPNPNTAAKWDLVHVDGDHTYDGCAHDLALADAAEAHWVLVDDFDAGPEVRAACRDFLLDRPLWKAEYVPDGLAGNLLLTAPTPHGLVA